MTAAPCRVVLWAFLVGLISATPLGPGSLFGAAEHKPADFESHIFSGDLPPRFSIAVKVDAETSVIQASRAVQNALASSFDDEAGWPTPRRADRRQVLAGAVASGAELDLRNFPGSPGARGPPTLC